MLGKVEEINSFRRNRYYQFTEEMQTFEELVFQKIPAGYLSSHHLLPFRYDGQIYGKTNHDVFEHLFRVYGIQPATQYYPLYRYKLFAKAGLGEASVPNTDHFYDNMVSLPFHHWITENDFAYMIASVQETANTLRRG